MSQNKMIEAGIQLEAGWELIDLLKPVVRKIVQRLRQQAQPQAILLTTERMPSEPEARPEERWASAQQG